MNIGARCCICYLLVSVILCGCADDTRRWIADLRDGDLQTQQNAMRALIDVDEATEELISAVADASHHDDVVIRTMAIAFLAKMRPQSPLARESLRAALDDTDPEIQFVAATALLEIDPMLPAPRSVVLSEIQRVNPHALVLVADLGSKAKWAAPALRELTRHSDDAVRELAQQALERVEAN